MPLWVMCKANWQGTFSRVVRDLDGKPLIDPVSNKERRIIFPPGEPVPVEGLEFLSIKSDIGKALVPIEEYTGGKPILIDLAKLPHGTKTLDEVAEEVRQFLLAGPVEQDPAESVVITAVDVGDVGGIVTDPGVADPDAELIPSREVGPDGTDIPRRRRRTRE